MNQGMHPTLKIVHSRKSAKNDRKWPFFDEKNSVLVSVSGRFRVVPGRSILFIFAPRHTGSPPVFWRGCALSDRDQLLNIVLSGKPVEPRRTPWNPVEPHGTPWDHGPPAPHPPCHASTLLPTVKRHMSNDPNLFIHLRYTLVCSTHPGAVPCASPFRATFSCIFPTHIQHTSYIPPKWYIISGGPIIQSQPPPAGLFVRFLPCRSSSSPTTAPVMPPVVL